MFAEILYLEHYLAALPAHFSHCAPFYCMSYLHFGNGVCNSRRNREDYLMGFAHTVGLCLLCIQSKHELRLIVTTTYVLLVFVLSFKCWCITINQDALKGLYCCQMGF